MDILAESNELGRSMTEGWYGEDYLVLFTEEEARVAAGRYGISAALPGFSVIGLRGWDDFILRDSVGKTFTAPTVPCDLKHLNSYAVPSPPIRLTPDERFTGKVKWYVNPIVFGGDPGIGENLIWVTHDKHAQLVQWWNSRYREVEPPEATGSHGQQARPARNPGLLGILRRLFRSSPF